MSKLDHKRRQGIPARALLAGGISHHGISCTCCRASVPTLSAAFARANEHVARLEAERDERDATRFEHVGGDWSPGQHARAS